MPPWKIAIARICYGGFHHAAVGDWLARTCHVIVQAGFGLESFWVDRHGVCVARNLAVETAKERQCSHLVMVDGDMAPDCMSGAPPFWDTSIAKARSHGGPCVISAPCVRADGSVCIYQEIEDDDGKHLIHMNSAVAAAETGIKEVPAASLALCLIDMRCFDESPRPYFRFGYTDDTESEVAWGEEAFTANCTERGIPVFCNWDAWCGHSKSHVLGKPKPSVARSPLWTPGGHDADNRSPSNRDDDLWPASGGEES
jgi:hypothetical protein